MPQKYTKETLAFAKVLRTDATPAERALWHILRAGKLGTRFRRQQPIGPFIADIYCASASLIVELDSIGHNGERDAERSAWLAERGYKVMRFTNAAVLERPIEVYLALMAALHDPHPGASRHPSPLKGEGKKD